LVAADEVLSRRSARILDHICPKHRKRTYMTLIIVFAVSTDLRHNSRNWRKDRCPPQRSAEQRAACLIGADQIWLNMQA
jgi:hypothetical protein